MSLRLDLGGSCPNDGDGRDHDVEGYNIDIGSDNITATAEQPCRCSCGAVWVDVYRWVYADVDDVETDAAKLPQPPEVH